MKKEKEVGDTLRLVSGPSGKSTVLVTVGPFTRHTEIGVRDGVKELVKYFKFRLVRKNWEKSQKVTGLLVKVGLIK